MELDLSGWIGCSMGSPMSGFFEANVCWILQGQNSHHCPSDNSELAARQCSRSIVRGQLTGIVSVMLCDFLSCEPEE